MSSASLMAVLLDPDLARHLVLALRRYRDDLAHRGFARPPGLAGLEALAEEVATGSQAQPRAARSRMPDDHGLRGKEWLSPKEVAMITGLSRRTVGRYTGNGELPSKKVGRRRLVARG